MNDDDRRLVKFACKIHNRLKARAGPLEERSLPGDAWYQLERAHRMLGKARERNWVLAANRLQNDLNSSLERLKHELMAIQGSAEPSDGPVASASDIFADLMTLQEEFEEASIDRREETISVTTAPIELEGVYLGPFEIVLEWLGTESEHALRYRVVALDPHPAASNDAVTHPHVQDEAVCEGDGRHAIRIALQQGRFLDLFLIVANLLQTYNDGSPYVALSDWHGIPCHDCGATMLEGEWWSCEKCDARICEHCYIHCSECDGYFCSSCSSVCDTCGDRFCDSCVAVCSECLNPNCQQCLDEHERCPDCNENEQENAADEPQSDTSLLTNRVGQAPVPQ